MWRCPSHQKAWDEMLAGLDCTMLQPAPAATLPMSFAEMVAMAERFPKPAADRLACAPDVWGRLKPTIPDAEPSPLGRLLGMRVLIDEDMPDGYWEIRDGDRVVSSATPTKT